MCPFSQNSILKNDGSPYTEWNNNFETKFIDGIFDRTVALTPPSVVPLPSQINSLNDCVIVEISDPNYGTEFWESLKNGTSFMQLNFLADKKFRSIWKRKNKNINGEHGTLNIIKDNDGWVVQNGNLVIPSRSKWEPQVDNITFDNNKIAISNKNWSKFSITTTGVPIKVGEDINANKTTAFARCFAVIPITSGGKTKWRYYIAGYEDGIDGDGKFEDTRTGVQFKNKGLRFSSGARIYELSDYMNLRIDDHNPGFISIDAWKRYENRNTITNYLKKLDEIAWYSKAQYPYIDRFTDPGQPGIKQRAPWDDLPYPQSYRRVKFRYNYELAKGTPNSKADKITYGRDGKISSFDGGRLTLKEARIEAGQEDNSISLPPYLFSYNGVNVAYNKFDNVDAWGMKTNNQVNRVFNEPQQGNNWNLTEILLPSCGSLSIDYERDLLESPLATIHKIKQRNKCFNSMMQFYPEESPGEFYIEKKLMYFCCPIESE
jgi:hypothetical protein